MTREERARAQKAYQEVYELIVKLTHCGLNFQESKSLIAAAMLAAERGVWEEAAKEAHRITEVADAAIEGCDGDELIRYNTIIFEFTGYRNWCRFKA